MYVDGKAKYYAVLQKYEEIAEVLQQQQKMKKEENIIFRSWKEQLRRERWIRIVCNEKEREKKVDFPPFIGWIMK